MIRRCLAPDVVLVSPLTDRFRFEGLEQVHEVLSAALGVIESVTFHTQVGDGSTRALFAHARVGGIEMEEAQLLRIGPSGIEEITLFIRPLPAATALLSALGPALAARAHRVVLSRALGAATLPLHLGARLGDAAVVPLAAPDRMRPAR